MTSIQDQLREHLRNGEDWEKMETPMPGIFIIKIPKTKTRDAVLNVEVNPLNDDGKPIKRKGLFMGNKETLVNFGELLFDDKVFMLMSEIDKVNGRDDNPNIVSIEQLKEDPTIEPEEEIKCVVDKTVIIGFIYICPGCKSYHCTRCARDLGKCWTCGLEVKIS